MEAKNWEGKDRIGKGKGREGKGKKKCKRIKNRT